MNFFLSHYASLLFLLPTCFIDHQHRVAYHHSLVKAENNEHGHASPGFLVEAKYYACHGSTPVSQACRSKLSWLTWCKLWDLLWRNLP
jgi:hypothetical protein